MDYYCRRFGRDDRLFFYLIFYCLTFFLLGDVVFSASVDATPINISITSSRARYMRFDGGRAARVVVEMMRNISENETIDREIATLQAYDKVPGDLAGTNYT